MSTAAAGERWTVLELIRWTQGYFERHGVPSARLDAELLLAWVMGVQRIDLYVGFERRVAEQERARFRELVRERATERVPVAYLTGQREFWSLPIRVTRDVLIPRPETETLVRVALELKPDRICEVGTGSGCLSAALASELPAARIQALDCSEAALEVARSNFEALGVLDRIELLASDGLTAACGPFDLLISNPPYIPSSDLDALEPEIGHEPRVALDGGADGLRFLRRLIEQAPEKLARPGWLALEVGRGQSPIVEEHCLALGAARVEIHKDLAGIERVVAARFEEA